MPLFFGTDYDVRLEVCWLFAAIPNDCLEAFFFTTAMVSRPCQAAYQTTTPRSTKWSPRGSMSSLGWKRRTRIRDRTSDWHSRMQGSKASNTICFFD